MEPEFMRPPKSASKEEDEDLPRYAINWNPLINTPPSDLWTDTASTMRLSGFSARLAGTLTVLNACVGSLALLPSAHIFPLYIYPGDGCTEWAPLLSTVPAYPDLQFIVVVNPNSGPGPAGSQPDANYQNCVTQLRNVSAANDNVKMIGYVLTGYGNRTSSEVFADVDTYAGWATAYHVEGIFFDEAANTPDMVSLYQSYASYVKTKFGLSAYITLNPGTWDDTSSPDYFSSVDLIVTFEKPYDEFALVPSL
ncbi:hypothetical protein C0995_004550 [Termitomyces sp. Mi166|nr:hypothetical protein C0995_004550 [Termitomyces sp. Mi166\